MFTVVVLAGWLGLSSLLASTFHDVSVSPGGLGSSLGAEAQADARGAEDETGESAPKEAHSTPVSEWKQGTVPHLYQIDGQWADVRYADGTLGTHGCGPTSLAMVYAALTGNTDKGPVEMAAFSSENGYIEAGLTSWLLMSDGAQRLGLTVEELPAEKTAVAEALAAGHPVICVVGPGDFTTDGHFMVLTAVDNEGNLTICDPNSVENSERTWPMKRVLRQCRNLWAYSR